MCSCTYGDSLSSAECVARDDEHLDDSRAGPALVRPEERRSPKLVRPPSAETRAYRSMVSSLWGFGKLGQNGKNWMA